MSFVLVGNSRFPDLEIPVFLNVAGSFILKIRKSSRFLPRICSELTHTHALTHTYAQTYALAHICFKAYTRFKTHTHTHALTQTYIHALTHTHTCLKAHAHRRRHTHWSNRTHILKLGPALPNPTFKRFLDCSQNHGPVSLWKL